MWFRYFWITFLVVTTTQYSRFAYSQSDTGCGLRNTTGTPDMTNSEVTSAAKFPWHVGVYISEDPEPVDYFYVCGGTLVRADIVISAAHCFYDEPGDVIRDREQFKLAVGKVLNALHDSEPDQQISSATEIILPERYVGNENYGHDIAIIRVNFTLSSVILPVCIDWRNALLLLNDGDIGEVPGWGRTGNGTESKIRLLSRTLPYISSKQCRRSAPGLNRHYITWDKFCAGTVGEVGVITETGGCGLVFQNNGKWYLRGVASLIGRNPVPYSAFTNVSQHIPWIKDVLGIRDNFKCGTSSHSNLH